MVDNERDRSVGLELLGTSGFKEFRSTGTHTLMPLRTPTQHSSQYGPGSEEYSHSHLLPSLYTKSTPGTKMVDSPGAHMDDSL